MFGADPHFRRLLRQPLASPPRSAYPGLFTGEQAAARPWQPGTRRAAFVRHALAGCALLLATHLPSAARGAAPPAPPTDIVLTLTAPTGVHLEWTNPLVDIDGAPFDDFGGVTLYRNGVVIAAIAQPTPDAARPTAYDDPVSPEGSAYQLATFDRRHPPGLGPLSAPVSAPPRLPGLAFEDVAVTGAWSPGVAPLEWSFTVNNSGYGPLAVSLTPSAAWLAVVNATLHVPPRGSTSFTLAADGAGLAEGHHEATLTLQGDDPGGTLRTITVNLEIGRPGLGLGLEPVVLGALRRDPPRTFTRLLTNVGAGRLSVQSTSDAAWLSVTPRQVVIAADENVPWVVRADPAGLEFGVHDGALHLATNDPDHPDITVPVHFTISPVPPTIGVSANTLSFSRWTTSPPRRQTLTITNSGEEALHVAEGHAAPWLGVAPHFLTVPAGGSGRLELTVDVAGRTSGEFSDTLVLSSDDPAQPQQSVGIALKLADPVNPLIVSPDTLDVTVVVGTPTPLLMPVLRNASPDSLAWEATGLPAWARLEPASGMLVPQGSVPLQVSFLADSVGVHEATVRLTTSAPVPGEASLALRLHVLGTPRIALDPDTLRFRVGYLATQPVTFTLENRGTDTQTFHFGAANGLYVSPLEGSLAPGERRVLTASLDALVYHGDYHGTAVLPLQVSHVNFRVPVELEIVHGRVDMAAWTQTLRRAPDAPPDTVRWALRNGGTVHASGRVRCTTPGLHLPGGEFAFDLEAGATIQVPAVVTPAEVPEPGHHFGAVRIEVNEFYATQSYPLSLRIDGAPPHLVVTPDTLHFRRRVGEPMETLGLRIENSGFEPLSGSLSTNPAWLDAYTSGFNATAHERDFLLITADPAGLPPGTYSGSVRLDSNDPDTPLRVVPVTLTITEPVLTVAPARLAIRQVGLQGFGVGDSVQFVELWVPTATDVAASSAIRLTATDHTGAPVLDGADLFAGLADGSPLPPGRSWLLAGTEFQAVTGLAPDRLLPLHLDPLGGELTLLDAGLEPPTILQRFAYGAAGGVEAPVPGGALQLSDTRVMQAVAVAKPTNAAGNGLSALPATCPVDTLEAGALRRTSRALGDGLRSDGPGSDFQQVTLDWQNDVFRVNARNGRARLVGAGSFVITGLPAGQLVPLDAYLEEGHRWLPSAADSGGATFRGRLRTPGTAGVVSESLPAGGAGYAYHFVALPLLVRVGEIFDLEFELTVEAQGGEAELTTALIFYRLPPGGQVVGCKGSRFGSLVPVALAAPLVTADPDRVRLEWRGATAIRAAQLQRRQEETAWRTLATLAPDADARLVYEDRDVQAGGHYAYRLLVDGEATPAVAVDVPRAAVPRLALRVPARVAGGRRIPLALEVPADGPITLELFDVQGRRVARGLTATLSTGHQDVTWDIGTPPAAGLYLLRAAQGSQSAVTRTMLLH